jgi:hypothetical protein
MSSQGRHRRSHLRGAPAAVLALLAAGLLLLTVAVLQLAGDPSTSTSTQGGSGAPAARGAANLTADECRAADQLAAAGLRAADTAMVQWRRHLDAMTDLVSGRISLAQATRYWDATRVAGKSSYRQWRRADAEFRAGAADCLAAAGDQPPVGACQVRVSSAAVLLAAERETLRTWRKHIRQMEALRAGRITPAHALHLWDSMYQRGLAGLRQVREAAKAFEDVTAAGHLRCAPSGSPRP